MVKYSYDKNYYFLLQPTNAQLSHISIYHNSLSVYLYSYMFRHFGVIIISYNQSLVQVLTFVP